MYKYFFGIKVEYSWEYPGINVAPPMLPASGTDACSLLDGGRTSASVDCEYELAAEKPGGASANHFEDAKCD